MNLNNLGQKLFCFKSEAGELSSGVNLPLQCNITQLTQICNQILENEEHVPYKFFINDFEITSDLETTINNNNIVSEGIIEITYQQQAVFRVFPITRCTASIPGHAEAVISVSFSPDGKHLASGSGDKTVRFWDVDTQTPYHTCHGHNSSVLCLAWSPDSRKLASACLEGKIIIWNPFSGKQIGKPMKLHKKWITALSWEPYHKNPECRYFVSASKDSDIRIWDSILCNLIRVLSGHTLSVTAVKWGGLGLIYSGSQDRTIKVWRANDGVLCRNLEGHAHWVNTIALSTDYVLKIGAFDPVRDDNLDTFNPDKKKSQEFALQRYKKLTDTIGERLVSGSDDFTLYLWNPESDKKPIARMTGHRQLVNDVRFSPDTRLIASASFDHTIKLWDSKTGVFITTFHGHVQAVYMISFSADSRLMVSGSADSTLKLWNIQTKKLAIDLPGHADEVYAVDWSTNGLKVASGGKDKLLRIWQN